MLGSRNASDAHEFVADLASRLRRHRSSRATDIARISKPSKRLSVRMSYAMLVKLYGHDKENERRYSAAQCIGAVPTVITGPSRPGAHFNELRRGQNWSVGTSMRRYTRLSNGFSRKIENHVAAVAINYFAYNFIKIHRTLRPSPAMAAGVTTACSTGRISSRCSSSPRKEPRSWLGDRR
jgi:hypothetical protein